MTDKECNQMIYEGAARRGTSRATVDKRRQQQERHTQEVLQRMVDAHNRGIRDARESTFWFAVAGIAILLGAIVFIVAHFVSSAQ